MDGIFSIDGMVTFLGLEEVFDRDDGHRHGTPKNWDYCLIPMGSTHHANLFGRCTLSEEHGQSLVGEGHLRDGILLPSGSKGPRAYQSANVCSALARASTACR